MLLNSGDEYISGEDLAEKLNVTRSAVWKAVGALKNDGMCVEAVRNRGYKLKKAGDILSTKAIEDLLTGDAKKCIPEVYGQVTSTNDILKRKAAQSAPENTVIIAGEQTAGRGRLGRNFYSPDRTGLYMSLLLRPDVPVTECLAVTACAAVAVARALEKVCGKSTKIKWVNDIQIDGKKVCGILTEGGISADLGVFDWLVIGIGINITSGEGFPDDISNIAGAIFENEPTVSRNEVAAAVLNELYISFKGLESRDFIDEYKSRSCVIGKEITLRDFSAGGKESHALAVDIDRNGGLVIRTDDGKEKVLTTGEISVRVTE